MDEYKKQIAKLMKNVKPTQVYIKTIGKQMTLDGGEDLEVEGWIRFKKGRMSFKLTLQVLQD